jgi:sterol 24-C-methyltransferase
VIIFCFFGKKEKGLTCSGNVENGIDEYNRLHSSDKADERNKEYKSLVNSYYDLATLFYEWGWGQSFHFANRYPSETFAESIRRHEYYLASKLNLSTEASKLKVLDVGCGIGGPMRNICKFNGTDVTGLTLNQYQVDRGNELCNLDPQLGTAKCRSVQGDFMEMPFEDAVYDAAYAIEATCHAPDRVGVYSEIYRVLKPGSIFACYEWCMTDGFDPNNKEHLRMKKQIEEGDGLPDICHTSVCVDAMKKAGFEMLDARDVAEEDYGLKHGGKPWMLPLLPSWNPFTQRFQFNWFGQALTKYSLKVLEFMYLAPKGTSQTQIMLQKGGIGLGDGGNAKIFTPMYLMVGRVPLDKK